MKKHENYTVLGRIIGAATGWEEGDGTSFCLCGFQPALGVDIPAVPFLWINFESGKAEIYDDNGHVIKDFDLITILRNIPRVE